MNPVKELFAALLEHVAFNEQGCYYLSREGILSMPNTDEGFQATHRMLKFLQLVNADDTVLEGDIEKIYEQL